MANPFSNIQQFFATYDRRFFSELSNDQNSPVVNPTVLNFLLDTEASRLESYLNGRVALPINPPLTYAQGGVAITSVPVNNSTVTIPNGTMSVAFTFLSGGVAPQIDTSSGNTATIAGLLATAINASKTLNVFAQSSSYFVAIVNRMGGTIGNVAITTTAAIQVVGMQGGTTQMPLILTSIVNSRTARRMFARRTALPDAIKADAEEADTWLGLFMDAKVTLPEIPPLNTPQLIDTDWFNGVSSWDFIMGTVPPRAPGSANPGYGPGALPGNVGPPTG